MTMDALLRRTWRRPAGAALLTPLRERVEQMLSAYQGKTVLYIPNPGNAGDSLLAAGTTDAFARFGVTIRAVGLDDNVDGQVVFLGGGGNFVPLYDHVRLAFQACLGRASKIILLPHTIRGNEDVLGRLDASCTVFCRDRQSFDHVCAVNPLLDTVLAHDMAFHLDVRRLMRQRSLIGAGRGIVRAKLQSVGLTEDTLRHWPSVDMLRIDAESRSATRPTDLDISMLFMMGVLPDEAPLAAWCFLRTISLAAHVNTDRLHVGIGAALLGVPCTLRDNSYGKNAAVYAHSLTGFPNLRFAPA